jgi:hypothetical protein
MPSQTTQQTTTQDAARIQDQAPPEQAAARADNSLALEQAGLAGGALPGLAANLLDALDILPEEQALATLEALPPRLALALHAVAFSHPAYQLWLAAQSPELVAESPQLCDKLLSRWLQVGTAIFGVGRVGGPGLPLAIEAERWLERKATDRIEMGADVAFSAKGAADISTMRGGDGSVLGAGAGAGAKATFRARLVTELSDYSVTLLRQKGPAAMLTGELDLMQLANWVDGTPPVVQETSIEFDGGARVAVDDADLAGGPLAGVMGRGGAAPLSAMGLAGAANASIHWTPEGAFRLRLGADAALTLESGSPFEALPLEALCEALQGQVGRAVLLEGKVTTDPDVPRFELRACSFEETRTTETRRLDFGSAAALLAFVRDHLGDSPGPAEGPDDIGARLQASGLVGLTRTLHLPLESGEMDAVVPDWLDLAAEWLPDGGLLRGVEDMELQVEARVDAAQVAAAYRGVRFVQPEPDLAASELASDILRGVLAHVIAGQEPPSWLPAPREGAALVDLRAPRLVGEVRCGLGGKVLQDGPRGDATSLDLGVRVDAPYEGEVSVAALIEAGPQLG